MTENNFENLLGKNGELVEERKKQVLAGALGIVQRHYKEIPNKMEAVAQLFGKQLGEEFTLIDENKKKYKAVINKNGLRVHGMYKGFWNDTFFKLIVGTVVIADD